LSKDVFTKGVETPN